MTPLPIPIPPQLLEAVGYRGDARLVSLCWTSSDKPWHDDGRSGGTGDVWAYLAFARHAAVRLHLAPYDLGGIDRDGRHRLLIDMEARTVSVGTVAEVREAVLAQWPVVEEEDLTKEQADEVLGHVRRSMASLSMPTSEGLMTAMRERSALVAAMVAWLDEWNLEEKR